MTSIEDPLAAMSGHGRRNALMVGEFHHGSAAGGLSEGFRALGWNVADVDLFDYFVIARSRAIRTANRVLEWAFAQAFNAAILTAAEQNRVKIVIFTKGSYVTRATLQALRARGVFTVNYYTDFHFGYRDVAPSTFALYDLMATTKSFQIEPLAAMIGRERVAFVHQGYAPAAHRRRAPPNAPREYLWDIAYSGTASPHKLDWLVEVAARFSNRRLIIVGDRWTTLAAGTPLAPFVLGHALSGDYYAGVIEQSRINLAVHFGRDAQMGWQDNVSTRTFEIPACGGFMLHIDNEEVRTLYDVPAEIDVFADLDELCGKIAHYIDRPELREPMIERAHARAVPAYSMHTRAVELAALIGERRRDRR